MQDYQKFWSAPQGIFTAPTPFGKIYMPLKNQSLAEKVLLLAKQPKTLQVIWGPGGSGKTTIVRWLQQNLEPKLFEPYIVCVLKPQPDRPWLLPKIQNFLLGSKESSQDPWRNLGRGLEQLQKERRILVLMIDACDQVVQAAAWQELKALFDLSSLAGSVVSCCLFGSESTLAQLLKEANLGHHLINSFGIPPYTREETQGYIQWYLNVSKIVPNPFAATVIDKIHQLSEGYPGRISILGEYCLLMAAQKRVKVIDISLLDSLLKSNNAWLQEPEPAISVYDNLTKRFLFQEDV